MNQAHDNKMIGFRPANKLRKDFEKKCNNMRKLDGYTTKSKVLIELMCLWVYKNLKIPGEE